MLRVCLWTVAVVAGVCAPTRAETFLATITSVEGDKVTYLNATNHAGNSGAEKYTHDDPVTKVAAKDVTDTRGHFQPLAKRPPTAA